MWVEAVVRGVLVPLDWVNNKEVVSGGGVILGLITQ
jgi:hypothetical protein